MKQVYAREGREREVTEFAEIRRSGQSPDLAQVTQAFETLPYEPEQSEGAFNP